MDYETGQPGAERPGMPSLAMGWSRRLRPAMGLLATLARLRHPPAVHRYPDRPAHCLALRVEEAGQHVDGKARRSAGGEGHEDHPKGPSLIAR
jgi:hypothetical protein